LECGRWLRVDYILYIIKNTQPILLYYRIASSLEESMEETNSQQMIKSLEESIEKLKEEKMNLETNLKTSKVEISSLKDRLDKLICQTKEDQLLQEEKYCKVSISSTLNVQIFCTNVVFYKYM